MARSLQGLTAAILVILCSPFLATAQERLCDTQFEDCREPILELIRNERQGIDVAFWFMEDARYVTELIKRHEAGVPVRILVDQRANASKRLNETMLNTLRDGGLPMRDRYVGDILHFKMMLFHGQNMVQFSKANYTSSAFVPIQPNVNYDDEAVFFTNDNNLTNSFRRRFDDLWINTSHYQNFANVSGPLVRRYPIFEIHPSMNFLPLEDPSLRMVGRFDREPQSIDAIVFRVTDSRLSDAVRRAEARGVAVRLITDPSEYRNPKRLSMAKEIDRMWMGGAQIKIRRHEGLTHEAAVVLHGLGEVIFGSSNWSPAVASGPADEHNYFYNPSLGKPWFFQWFVDQFDSKWNDTVNYGPFAPLPPDAPSYSSPLDLAAGLSSSVQLDWEGGPWAHLYDIYVGTTPDPPLLTANRELGSPTVGTRETYTVHNLLPGTTYYWRVVGKTWARIGMSGPVWSFRTAGTPPGGDTETAPYGGSPAPIPGTVEAENFDEGGQGSAYADTTAGNSGGAHRTATDVDIEPTADSGGGYNLSKTRVGEWLKYTLSVAITGTYRLETRAANIGTGARFHVEVDGVDRTGPIAVPDTGGWQTWQTIATNSVPLTAGPRVIRVVFDSVATSGAMGNFNWFRLSLVQGAPPPPPPPPPSTSAYGGTPAALPGTFQAENFDEGGEGVAYHDMTGGNSGGAHRATDVDIEATTDAGGGYNLSKTRAGEWLKYTVSVGTTGTYRLEARVANMGTGAKFHVEVDGVDRTGPIVVPDTGGWQTWQTITTAGVPLTAGQHVVRVVFDSVASTGAMGNYNWFRLVSTP